MFSAWFSFLKVGIHHYILRYRTVILIQISLFVMAFVMTIANNLLHLDNNKTMLWEPLSPSNGR